MARAINVFVRINAGYILMMDIEDYLCGVVPAEMPPTWATEALKAQAIAARTYALANIGRHAKDGYDLCSTQHCQVWKSARYASCSHAVVVTAGVIGVDKENARVRPTYYSASCGGKTENSWGKWLKKVDDCPCAELKIGRRGHGQGLCQWGAKLLAERGWSWREILDFYFDLLWLGDYGAERTNSVSQS